MKPEQPVTDELLNAFVDNELDSAEKSRLLGLIAADGQLKQRICELWQLKEMVGNAYPLKTAGKKAQRSRWGRFGSPGYSHALAAGLFLALGLGGGWLLRGGNSTAPLQNTAQVERQAKDSKLVLHIFSGESVRFEAALDQAEELMRSAEKLGTPVKLDIVANGEGLRLLQADASPYPERIKSLQHEYKDLNFYACGITIEKLRQKGVNVRLLPEAVITPSALDLIVAREKQGWMYIQA